MHTRQNDYVSDSLRITSGMLRGLLCLALLHAASAMYTPKSGIVALTADTFEASVVGSLDKQVWIVEVRRDGC